MSVKVVLAVIYLMIANAHARICVCTATLKGGDVNLRSGPGTGMKYIVATVPVSRCYDYVVQT